MLLETGLWLLDTVPSFLFLACRWVGPVEVPIVLNYYQTVENCLVMMFHLNLPGKRVRKISESETGELVQMGATHLTQSIFMNVVLLQITWVPHSLF